MPDRVVEMQGYAVSEPQPLLQLVAIHRGAADRGDVGELHEVEVVEPRGVVPAQELRETLAADGDFR